MPPQAPAAVAAEKIRQRALPDLHAGTTMKCNSLRQEKTQPLQDRGKFVRYKKHITMSVQAAEYLNHYTTSP